MSTIIPDAYTYDENVWKINESMKTIAFLHIQ